MKAVKTITNPEAFEILADQTRRKIIYLLKVKELTVSQIASEMGLTAQAIYHHIRKMKKVGVIEVAREERVGHFIETYYRSAAEMFHLSCGETKGDRATDELVRSCLEGLTKIGMISKPDEKAVKKIVALTREMDKCSCAGKWTDKIENLDDVGFFAKQYMLEYAAMIAEDDKSHRERVKKKDELREFLKSCCPADSKPKRKRSK